MPNLNITNIPAPRVPFIDERTGLMAREWYRFFLNLFVLTGSGNNPITLEELQIGPPNQPDLAELLIQINQNIAPQYEDQSGDFLATLDTAQLMSMMARFENAEAAIQGAYLQPVVQTGTIANYNLDGSPTAGGVAYGTGPALAVSAAGTLGQVLTSGGAGAPTWATDGRRHRHQRVCGVGQRAGGDGSHSNNDPGDHALHDHYRPAERQRHRNQRGHQRHRLRPGDQRHVDPVRQRLLAGLTTSP
jgi:hypothetical protein